MVRDITFIYLATISSIQIYHVQLIHSSFQEQDEKVIGVRNACVTNSHIFALRCQLNSLDEFSIESVDQEQVVAEARVGKVWPASTLGSHEREYVTHYIDIFVVKHLLSGIRVVL